MSSGTEISIFERALVLTGPTAGGKSALALDLAEEVGAEIVALDSMTVYRGMDIGTAKPSVADRARVPHHLIDVLDPWQSLTVAAWLERARAACEDILARGRRPLLVGGTPFYLKALLHGLFPGPPGDEGLRRELEAEAEREGREALHRRLEAIDPRTAARLHPNDVRRVVRALEVHALTGRPISAWQTTWDSPGFTADAAASPPPARIPVVVLERPRPELYERINRRVEAMFAAGWVEEVRRLRTLPHPLSREASQALGYREMLSQLDSPPAVWSELVELIQTRTRQFAKRQLTWFRHLAPRATLPAGGNGLIGTIWKIWKEFD